MKLSVLLLAAATSFSVFATEKETIKSTISDVTVYTQGAQIYRKATYSVKPGTTQLVIEGVSPNIDPNSLQVKVFGNVVQLDSKYTVYYPKPTPRKLDGIPLAIRRDINLLTDSLEVIAFDIQDITDEIAVLNAAKAIITGNGAMRGTGKVNDSLPLLKGAVEFYQTKMTELNKKISTLNQRKLQKERARQRMNERLANLKNYQNSNAPEEPDGPIHQIVITVTAKEAATGRITLSYLVSGANWVPSYDLRSDILTGKVNLTYKASVSQNTGEDWNDVRLTVSTNDPYANKTRPILHPWYIDFYVAQNYYDKPQYAYSNVAAPSVQSESAKKVDSESLERDAETAKDFTTVIDRVLSAEFKIDLPYTIANDGEAHYVLVKEVDLDADYKYISVPKLDAGAFLVAQIVKLDELQLVPAKANIFFDGTYMGETYLDPTTMDDTLSLSLGKDPNILVRRTLLKKGDKEKILSNGKKERMLSYEIQVKNLKSTNIDIIVKDQLPVTTNTEIEIEGVDLGKAKFNETTGILDWEFSIKAHETKVFNFSFKVRHDKDKQLVL